MSDLVTKFQNWLKNIKQPPEDKNENISDKNSNVTSKINEFTLQQLNELKKIKVFENKTLIVFVEKSIHRRLKRFKFLDNLFQIKIEIKKDSSQPLLKDLLEVFDEVFKFILNHIKTFFDESHHNTAYLTLFQNPMVNGINTGQFLVL